MSRSPADEYEPPARTGARVPESSGTRSFVRRAVDRLRHGLRRCVTAVRRLVESDASPADLPPDAADRRGELDSQETSHLMITTSEAAGDASDEPLPERDRPFTRPSREGADNPPEPVARIEGEELTVELPDEPGATITSDVWERVER